MRKVTWLKTFLALVILSLSTTSTILAGGILTNTNLSARYARLLALEASISVDAAYHNPAGTVKLPEGFHFAVANQTIIQERKITSTFPYMMGDGPKEYIGETFSPIVPSIQGVYKKGKWALSGSFGVVGGGGKATFNDGLPMFESAMAGLMPAVSGLEKGLNKGILENFLKQYPEANPEDSPKGALSSKGYSFNQYLQGQSYIFGLQLGGAYQINDMFSVYAGARLSLVSNKNEGYLTDLMLDIDAKGFSELGIPISDNSGYINPNNILGMIGSSLDPESDSAKGIGLAQRAATEGAYLDNKQSGWGVSPIVGVHFSHGDLNIGVRYEFKSSFDVENETAKDVNEMFPDGEKVNHDLPALFSMGASYDIIPNLTASIGYHHFFEKDAAMTGGKQKLLSGNTNEYLAGIEYQINDMFLVSAGTQFTRFGMTDEFQSDLSFFPDSYSIGFGGAVNLSKNVQLNAGYFFTNYSDYTKASDNYNDTDLKGSDTYNRENQIFAIGVEFSF